MAPSEHLRHDAVVAVGSGAAAAMAMAASAAGTLGSGLLAASAGVGAIAGLAGAALSRASSPQRSASAARDTSAGLGAAVGAAAAALGSLAAGGGLVISAAAAGLAAGSGGLGGALVGSAVADHSGSGAGGRPGLTADQAAMAIVATLRGKLKAKLPDAYCAPAPNPSSYSSALEREAAKMAHQLTQAAAVITPTRAAIVAKMAVAADKAISAVVSMQRTLLACEKQLEEHNREKAADVAAGGAGDGGAAASAAAPGALHVPPFKALQTWEDLLQLWHGGFRIVIKEKPGPPHPPLSGWDKADCNWSARDASLKSKHAGLVRMYNCAKDAAAAAHAEAHPHAAPLTGDSLAADAAALLLRYHKCLHKPTDTAYDWYREWFQKREKKRPVGEEDVGLIGLGALGPGVKNPFLVYPPSEYTRGLKPR
jgi:hypothetical protein